MANEKQEKKVEVGGKEGKKKLYEVVRKEKREIGHGSRQERERGEKKEE